jgi:hypothetical protein
MRESENVARGGELWFRCLRWSWSGIESESGSRPACACLQRMAAKWTVGRLRCASYLLRCGDSKTSQKVGVEAEGSGAEMGSGRDGCFRVDLLWIGRTAEC